MRTVKTILAYLVLLSIVPLLVVFIHQGEKVGRFMDSIHTFIAGIIVILVLGTAAILIKVSIVHLVKSRGGNQ